MWKPVSVLRRKRKLEVVVEVEVEVDVDVSEERGFEGVSMEGAGKHR